MPAGAPPMRFIHRNSLLSGQELGKLPLTSLIDVIFLLLIFFMLTSSFTPDESELASALQSEKQSAGRAADLQPQVVSVEMSATGPIFRLGARALTTQADLEGLLRALPKEGGVFVKVSGDVPVGAAAAALQASKDAGFKKVSYVPAK